MKRIVLAAMLAVLTAVPAGVVAQDKKPDFSGKWTLDESKSNAGPGGGAGRAGRAGRGGGALAALAGTNGPVLISQTDTEITIGAITYKLNGTTPQGPRGGAESKTHWDGAALVIETTISARGTTATTKEVRKLSDDGKEMTVETTISAPRGNVTTKRVFTKA
jgi:hypothetical protein